MINNKKKKKITKKLPQYRTKEERSNEVKEILIQLNHFNLNAKYTPVKTLYTLFKRYINDAESIIVNIPFPDIHRRFKGFLATNKKQDVTIALLKENF